MGTRTLLLLTLTLLVSACSSVQAQTIPAATLSPDSDSNLAALSAAEQGTLGKPAIVFFHAQWCNICNRVRPILNELTHNYVDQLAVVQLDIDDNASDGAVDRYRVNATPTFVLFSASGNALASIPGWPGREAMELTIRQLLVEP